MPVPNKTPCERKTWYGLSFWQRDTIISEKTQRKDPNGITTYRRPGKPLKKPRAYKCICRTNLGTVRIEDTTCKGTEKV